MKKSKSNETKALEKLRLPELQAKFAEVTGEKSRSPNRTFLIRRITEALAAREAAPASAAGAEAKPTAPAHEPAPSATEPAAATDASAGAATAEVKLSKLSVEELQAKYREVVGRDTGSSAKGYLLWKIRQAQKGRIPVGPRRTRRADGEAGDFKVLPLRMDTEPLCVTSIRRLIKQIWLLLDGL
ncbi:MAG: hypothetical protein FJ125_13915 [Deltaproteobacteria bacterium]|nr:hypothetical protein [Deltaproteobacteria bacterium]